MSQTQRDYATAQVADADLVPGNVKSGVNILGVQGSVVELNGATTTVHSGATQQTVTPTAPANGFTSVTVEPLNLEAKSMPLGAQAPAAVTPTSGKDGLSQVTPSIDSTVIKAANIKSGATILGVDGSVVELNGSTATVKSTTSSQTVTPTSPSNGFTSVTVNPIVLENGTMPLGAAAPATVTPTSGNDGLAQVAPSIDTTVIKAENIKNGVNILGVSGSVVELNGSTTSVKSTTSSQTITPTSPSNGFTSVTVNPIVLENGTMPLGASAPTTVTPSSGNDGLAQVAPSVDTTVVKAENIKSGVSILGVAGSLTPGITPTGNINITNTDSTDVTNYATAQVVDANLAAGNIKSGVSVLGVTGAYSGEPAVVVPTSITLGADAPTTVVPPSAGSGKNKFNIAASGMGTTGTLQQDGSYLLPG